MGCCFGVVWAGWVGRWVDRVADSVANVESSERAVLRWFVFVGGPPKTKTRACMHACMHGLISRPPLSHPPFLPSFGAYLPQAHVGGAVPVRRGDDSALGVAEVGEFHNAHRHLVILVRMCSFVCLCACVVFRVFIWSFLSVCLWVLCVLCACVCWGGGMDASSPVCVCVMSPPHPQK